MNYRKWIKWTLMLFVLGVGAYLFVVFDLRSQFSEWFREDVRAWLANHPVLAPFVYFLIYVVAVVGFMPGSVVTLVGGALFGPILGTVYVSLASTTAAAVAFLIARYLAADWVERRASGKLEKVKKGIDEQGWKFVAFTRLVPIFPYTLLNYMFGLTGVRFWTYVWVSWICMLPATFAYVYLGFAGQQAVVGGIGLRKLVLVVGSAIALIILVSMLPKWIRKWQDEEIEEIVEEETS